MKSFNDSAVETLASAGFSEMSGGDDFTSYAKDSDPTKVVYLFNLSWEFHDFNKQTDDSKPQLKGKSVSSLARVLK